MRHLNYVKLLKSEEKLQLAGASKNSKGAGRSRKDELIAIATTAMATATVRGISASARGTSGIALRDRPSFHPRGLFQSAAPTEIASL